MTIMFGPGVSLGAGVQVLPEPPTYLWAWGRGASAYGILGTNTEIDRSSPVQVGALTNWSKITIAGQTYNYPAMIAIKTTGEAWGWGAYPRQIGNAQVGNNTSSPVLVGGGLTWAKINQGNHYNVNGITTDGKMWVWGQLTRGAGGNNVGMAYGQTTPLQSGALTTWSQVNSASTLGIKHNLAIKTDGTLWAWGSNDNGVLGLGTAAVYLPGSGGKFGTDASSPIQVGSATTWTSITASTHTLGIKTV